MSIFIDIILAAVICYSLIRHLRLGLVCSILNFAKFLLSFVAALLLGGYVGGFIASHFENVAGMKFFGVGCYVAVFIGAYILQTLLIKRLSKLEIPVVTAVDKLLGALLGLILGFLSASMMSVIIFTVLDIASFISGNEGVMSVYADSYVFKFIYDFKIFDFLRSLF